jgi:pre-mRNA-splicing factor SYF1
MYVSYHPAAQNCTEGPSQGGTKIERARELFDQALEQCPQKLSKPLFLMYAQLEEEHGLAKRALSIYDRATRGVADEDKFEVTLLYLKGLGCLLIY